VKQMLREWEQRHRGVPSPCFARCRKSCLAPHGQEAFRFRQRETNRPHAQAGDTAFDPVDFSKPSSAGQ